MMLWGDETARETTEKVISAPPGWRQQEQLLMCVNPQLARGTIPQYAHPWICAVASAKHARKR